MERATKWLQNFRRLRKLGATWRSLILFPLRRRILRMNYIGLVNGIKFSAPDGEPLIRLIYETWDQRCYLDTSWKGPLPAVILLTSERMSACSHCGPPHIGQTVVLSLWNPTA